MSRVLKAKILPVVGRFLKYIDNQRGFTMLEVVITVTIIGVLASVAVPRFTSSLEKANTAKVQADLQTLDTAVAMYEAENGKSPNTLTDLAPFILDIPTPPKGKCRLRNDNDTLDATGKSYELKDITTNSVTQRRAVLDNHPVGDFGK